MQKHCSVCAEPLDYEASNGIYAYIMATMDGKWQCGFPCHIKAIDERKKEYDQDQSYIAGLISEAA